MIKGLLGRAVTTSLGRWILGGLVATLLGTAAIMWHNHKEDLRDEGAQECVNEVNLATIEALENALAAEKRAAADLRANLIAAARVNAETVERKNELSRQLDSLRGKMEEQKKNDETYRDWSDSSLPSGVADRVRQAAGSEADDHN